MNAWGIIVLLAGAGVLWWSVKHAGSLGSLTAPVYGGNVNPAANQHGANPWAPFPDLNNLWDDIL